MAEEFINQGGVCSGNWWNPSRNTLFGGCLLPCSGAAGDVASFTWPVDSNVGCLASYPANCDWSQGLLFGGGASKVIRTSNQSNPSKVMHESGSYDTSQIRNNWSPGMTGSFSGNPVDDHEDASSQISAFNRQISFPAQTSENYSNHNLSSSCGYHSSKVKSFLLDQPPLLFENHPNLPVVDCSSQFLPNYGSGCSADSSPTSFGKFPALLKPINCSLHNPRQASRLQFPNSIPYNASMSASDDIRASLLASPESTLNRSNLITKASSQYSQISGSLEKKVSQEAAPKRPRIETPSPLPTFKVRKEKLGDRITALQQLVSPFGKTDTASVLHEAIESIKFLHDQVNALSTPYMKNGAPFQHQQVSTERAMKGTERPELDLRSRGLCLVPISSTFPVTCEIPTDFWPPTFRGSFR